MKLYTVVVHNLQMCMKEYSIFLIFRRGDNSTYTFTNKGVVYLVSATPPKRLIGVLWKFTQLLYTTCRCGWRNMVAVQNLKGEIIQLILSRKGGGHVPCKRNSYWTAYWIFMKLYTVVVHNLQICMKEYRCCLEGEIINLLIYLYSKVWAS
jgi:hypothetical protein